jgi:predicted acylesterase/phospholipase RssA
MDFKILAFGGGGSRGILHSGAIKYLEENNMLSSIKELYGCSVGSIFATALAFGLNSQQIEKLSKKFTSFEDFFFKDLTLDIFEQNFEKKGFFEMDNLETFFNTLFFEETGLELKDKKISDSLLPLRICATNITKNCLTVFQGDISVLKAIRASCCLPGIFCPQKINDSLYIDGGYLTNMVLDFIPLEKKDVTLEIAIKFDKLYLNLKTIKSMEFPEFLYSLYKIGCIYERKLKKRKNILELYYKLTSGISDVSELQNIEMIEKGYKLTRLFFTKNSF